MSEIRDTAPPVPEGEIHVHLLTGGVDVLSLGQGSEWLWGYLDALSNCHVISVQEYRSCCNAVARMSGVEGLPRTEERR